MGWWYQVPRKRLRRSHKKNKKRKRNRGKHGSWWNPAEEEEGQGNDDDWKGQLSWVFFYHRREEGVSSLPQTRTLRRKPPPSTAGSYICWQHIYIHESRFHNNKKKVSKFGIRKANQTIRWIHHSRRKIKLYIKRDWSTRKRSKTPRQTERERERNETKNERELDP